MPSRTTLRRAGLLLAVPALALSGLALTGSPASAVPDPGPADDAATWITGELTDGLMHNPNFGGFDDLGLSADTALGLAALGGNDAPVDEITDAIEPRAEAEWYTSSFGGVTTTYAGSLAKALVLAQTAGSPVTDFGGENLVTGLEDLVAPDAPIAGRIEDVNNDFGDANVIGQAFAAQGLAAAGSDDADAATNFLLKQQCGAGYFRLGFTEDKEAARQRCVDGAADSEPDTDATALAMMSLAAIDGDQNDQDVQDALAAAEEWLLDVQRADGSFGGGPSTEAPNTNSTGLAAWALGLTDETAAAERAASWVRGLQTVNVDACAPWADTDAGAIAYDRAGHVAGQNSGITDADVDQWRRATAQALPGLALTPAGASAIAATAPAGFRQAGTDATVAVSGAVPGSALCATLGTGEVLGAAGATGSASLKVALPAGTATRTVSVTDGTTTDTVEYDVLGKLKVPFTRKASVAKGKQQVVKVSGLEPGEAVKVTFRGRRVDSGVANGQGKFTSRFPVTGRTGKATVEVFGQFPTRHASKTFRVTA